MTGAPGYLEISSLTKRYKEGITPAVADVSLSVAEGEFLALLGPSGCGKTTTLRMIAGLIDPTSGTVTVDGKDITHAPVHKRSVGMVFQSYALFPHLDVKSNVAYGLQMRRVPKAEITKRVADVLKLVRLDHLADRRITALSGGQQQRVALARAVVIHPQLFLMDEPLSNLDAKLRDAMRNEIRGIQQRMGITSVFVTHDQGEALTMADKIAVMSEGKLEQFGSPTDIYERPATRFVAEFVGQANLCAALGAGVADRFVVEVGDVESLACQLDGLADPVGDGLVVDDECAVLDRLDERAAVVAGHPLEDRSRDLVDGEGCGCHGVLLGT